MASNATTYGCIVVVMLLPLFPAKAETSNALSEADFQKIDAYIETQLKEADIPGAALVIVEGNRITHLPGYGVAGSDGRPVTAETGFCLASISKSFTALAIMQLVEVGQIELDAPVQKYLPWFQVADAEASGQMKVRHLLNHTSGFSTYAGRTHLASRDMSAEAIERRVCALRKAKLTARPGEGLYYSNANYSVLGAIIQYVSGQSYEDYIEQHIFAPLHMTHSYTSAEAAKQHDLATGYRYWFGHPLPATHIPRSRGDVAASHLISCAADMGNYLVAHMNGGAFGDTRILSEEGVSQLHTPERKSSNYAMGWVVKRIDSAITLCHSGTGPDFHAGMAIFPEHQRGFALLINAENFLSGPYVGALVDMTELQMLGIMAFPVRKAPTVHPYLAALCALLLGQVIGLILKCRQLCQWWKLPDTRPTKKLSSRLIRISFFIVVDIALVVALLRLVPRYRGITLSGLLLYAPDAGWLLLLNGALALVSVTILGTEAIHILNVRILSVKQPGREDWC